MPYKIPTIEELDFGVRSMSGIAFDGMLTAHTVLILLKEKGLVTDAEILAATERAKLECAAALPTFGSPLGTVQ